MGALQPRTTNPRTHSKKQITQIANAIRRFGFTNPILVDDANGIVAGHGRIEAAKIVGLDQVPTVRLPAMSEAENHAAHAAPSTTRLWQSEHIPLIAEFKRAFWAAVAVKAEGRDVAIYLRVTPKYFPVVRGKIPVMSHGSFRRKGPSNGD